MNEYKTFLRKRRKKQFTAASFFLVFITAGRFYPLIGLLIPLCMVFGIGISFARGRKWCDFFCPRGSFLDSVAKPASRDKKIPGLLRSTPFRAFFLVFFMAVVLLQITRIWPSPEGLGLFFVNMLTITTAAGVLLALFIHRRAWCSFCPIGSAACAVGKGKQPLYIDSEKCTECGACLKACPLQLSPYLHAGEGVQKITEGDCVKCGLCVRACPAQALNFEGEKKWT
jgi:ferredoxin-type protein NapH